MSVQISGSTLFNVLQVTQEFFSLTSEEPLKGKVKQSGNEKFRRVKEAFLGSSDSPRVASLEPVSSVRSPARPPVCSFQSPLQRI